MHQPAHHDVAVACSLKLQESKEQVVGLILLMTSSLTCANGIKTQQVLRFLLLMTHSASNATQPRRHQIHTADDTSHALQSINTADDTRHVRCKELTLLMTRHVRCTELTLLMTRRMRCKERPSDPRVHQFVCVSAECINACVSVQSAANSYLSVQSAAIRVC